MYARSKLHMCVCTFVVGKNRGELHDMRRKLSCFPLISKEHISLKVVAYSAVTSLRPCCLLMSFGNITLLSSINEQYELASDLQQLCGISYVHFVKRLLNESEPYSEKYDTALASTCSSCVASATCTSSSDS